MTTPDPRQYKVGDIVNGHRLQSDHTGTLAWVPVTATAPAPASGDAPAAAKPKRKWYTRKRVLIPAGVLALFVIIGSIGNANRDTTPSPEEVAVSGQTDTDTVEEAAAPKQVTAPDVTGLTVAEARKAIEGAGLAFAPKDAAYADDFIVTGADPTGTLPEGASVVVVAEAPKPKMTLGQENALKQAQNYVDVMPFSKAALYGQLTSEYGGQFDEADAQFAVDNVTADWNAEAAESAKAYMDAMAMSRDALYDQLVSEYGGQFTPDEANAGIAAAGY